MEKFLRLGFPTLNKKVEYETLLAGIAIVGRLGREVIEIYSNSCLVVGQVNGQFEAKH